MQESQRLEAIKHVLSTIFTSQEILRTLAPEYKWAGLGNLLGDYGECLAIHSYGLTKVATGVDGYDALTSDGKTVQIKANHAATQIGLRGKAETLLVLKINSDGTFEEIYFNSYAQALGLGYESKRDNKVSIPVSKLKRLGEEIGSLRKN